MKRKAFIVLSFICITFGIILSTRQKLWAETKSEFPILFEEGDFKYTVNEDNSTVTVEEYIGYETDVMIPDMIDGKPVVSVAYKQGFERKLITSITIPESVEKIEERMFLAYCDESMFDPSYILNIYVSDNNNFFSSENGILYNKDKTELIKCPRGRQGEISNLPKSLKRIRKEAFKDCDNLTHIELPDDIVSIESWAFNGCDSLKSIKLPENLKEMGQSVFFNCISLMELKLPNGLEHIQTDSFGGCTSLKQVELPEELKRIDEFVFSTYEGFEEIHYPKDEASWNKIQIGGHNDALKKKNLQMGYQVLEDGTAEITDAYCFVKDNCFIVPEEINGKKVTGIGDELLKDSGNLECVILPEGLTRIGHFAFANCKSLKEINFPESLEVLGDSAFRSCKSLEKVHLPEKIKKIGDGAFYFCEKLEEIELPEDLESVGEEAFGDCMSLESITIPGKIMRIGRGAFYYCKNLKDVYYPKTIREWNRILISRYNDALTEAEIHYQYGNSFVEQDISYSKSKIEWEIFHDGYDNDDPMKTNISYNDNIKYEYRTLEDGTIEITASDLRRETKIVVPEKIDGKKVTRIGNNAFADKQYLEYIELPEGIVSIGDGAFFTCRDLMDVHLPESLESIGDNTFNACRNLREVRLPEGVKQIGNGTFSYCKALESVQMPTGLKDIGNKTFWGCLCLKEIKLPENLNSIGDYAFANCKSLQSITLPEGITSIGRSAFGECRKLDNINLPEGLTTIGRSAFSDCEMLQSIVIPEMVKEIGEFAFENCTGLKSIEFPEKLNTVGQCAFRGCKNLENVYYPQDEDAWNEISMESGNEVLESADIDFHCNSVFGRIKRWFQKGSDTE